MLRNWLTNRKCCVISVTAALLLVLLVGCAASVDVRVGEDVTLECRFNPALMDKRHTFYWIRQNIKEKDNVAIGESPLEKNYRLVFNAFFFF